jgi:hypothetical protein
MQSITNIDELRNTSLKLIDDIINEKYELKGEDSEAPILNHVNKQFSNVLAATSLEMRYSKDKKIKFMEYENK